jgi:hypothetical protein
MSAETFLDSEPPADWRKFKSSFLLRDVERELSIERSMALPERFPPPNHANPF